MVPNGRAVGLSIFSFVRMGAIKKQCICTAFLQSLLYVESKQYKIYSYHVHTIIFKFIKFGEITILVHYGSGFPLLVRGIGVIVGVET